MTSISQRISLLPHQPGCYLFKNAAGQLIYIGKAKDLRKRVSSYFRAKQPDPKTARLVQDIAELDYLVTTTELEALLLEARLIHQHQPKYNLELKGGTRYAYIRITAEEFPRLETARVVDRHDRLFGPYVQGSLRVQLMRLANDLFGLRVGKAKPSKVQDRFRIRLSVPPWNRLVTPHEYQQDIAKAQLLLSGKMPELQEKLEKEMKFFSSQQRFELARQRRDQLSALRQLSQKQTVQLRTAYDQDVIAFVALPGSTVVQLFTIIKGVISGRKQFTFENFSLDDFLVQYYYANEIPQEIIISASPAAPKLLAEYLARLEGHGVRLTVPTRGDKQRLLELVKKNILVSLERGDQALLELQNALSLPRLPAIIECFDISNLGADSIVGSMVYFKNGLADKSNYRRFKIRWPAYVPTSSGLRRVDSAAAPRQSDVDAIREVVYRRYARLLAEHAVLPDLVLIDGGKPQLGAAREALRRVGLALPLAALAKRNEELFLPARRYPIRLSRRSAGLQLVQKIRDEAHRFAITYHRLLREKPLKNA